MSERRIENCINKAGIQVVFCPTDLAPEATWFADNRLNALAVNKSRIVGENGETVVGINIYINSEPDRIRDLFEAHLGWVPPIFPFDGHLEEDARIGADHDRRLKNEE